MFKARATVSRSPADSPDRRRLLQPAPAAALSPERGPARRREAGRARATLPAAKSRARTRARVPWLSASSALQPRPPLAQVAAHHPEAEDAAASRSPISASPALARPAQRRPQVVVLALQPVQPGHRLRPRLRLRPLDLANTYAACVASATCQGSGSARGRAATPLRIAPRRRLPTPSPARTRG